MFENTTLFFQNTLAVSALLAAFGYCVKSLAIGFNVWTHADD